VNGELLRLTLTVIVVVFVPIWSSLSLYSPLSSTFMSCFNQSFDSLTPAQMGRVKYRKKKWSL